MKFPLLKLFHPKGSSPAPVEFYGTYESEPIAKFLMDRVKEPFAMADDTDALLDFMMTKALKGIHFFFVLP